MSSQKASARNPRSVSVNHPTNFVVAKTTRRGLDQSENPHHFWHSLFLHPQTHNAPAEPIPIYVVRPLFPFYPPITQGFRTVEELRKKLASLGAPQLPEVWENRILEFSKATKHKPYAVPKEFHEITRMFGDLYKAQNKDPSLEPTNAFQPRRARSAIGRRFFAGRRLCKRQTTAARSQTKESDPVDRIPKEA